MECCSLYQRKELISEPLRGPSSAPWTALRTLLRYYVIKFKVLKSTTSNIFTVLADVTSNTISVWRKLKGHLKSYKKLRYNAKL